MMMSFDDEMMQMAYYQSLMTIEFRLIQNLWKTLDPKTPKQKIENIEKRFLFTNC